MSSWRSSSLIETRIRCSRSRSCQLSSQPSSSLRSPWTASWSRIWQLQACQRPGKAALSPNPARKLRVRELQLAHTQNFSSVCGRDKPKGRGRVRAREHVDRKPLLAPCLPRHERDGVVSSWSMGYCWIKQAGAWRVQTTLKVRSAACSWRTDLRPAAGVTSVS